LGYCFQIQDDLLDLTSDFSGLKKQTGNDIYEGKRTLMLLHLFRNAKGKDLKKLTDIMAKSREEKTAADVTWIITKMGEYGSLDHGRQLISKFIKEAKDYFSLHLDFLSTEPYRSQLLSFVDFLSTRDH
jgi:geranylgeranyl diphosphate synthase type II